MSVSMSQLAYFAASTLGSVIRDELFQSSKVEISFVIFDSFMLFAFPV